MILTAVSGITLGILLGGFLLLKEPPLRGKGPSGVEKMGDYATYYTPGSIASAESATVRSRISRLARQVPGAIPFTEMEINHYMSQFQSAETTEDGKPADVAFSPPNVRIENEAFVLSTKLVFNPKGDRFEVLVQAMGRFENGESGVALKVDRLLLNSLPVPQFGGLVQNLFMKNAAAIPLPTEVQDSLGAIKEIELLPDQVVLML